MEEGNTELLEEVMVLVLVAIAVVMGWLFLSPFLASIFSRLGQ